MMFYVLVLLVLIDPFAFGISQITEKRSMVMLIGVFSATVLLPGFGIMLLKPLGFLNDYQRPAREERIGPYIILSILYVWVYKNLTGGLGFPEVYAQLFLGATIALFVAFFINNWLKVSAHMNGVGGLVGALLILLVRHYPGAVVSIPCFGQIVSISLTAVFITAVFLAAATAYARLALSAHTFQQVWIGFVVGLGGQILAMLYYSAT
jgi:hypothetical protein